MKLHEMHAHPNRKSSLHSMLGLKRKLRSMFSRADTPQSEHDSSQKDKDSGEQYSSAYNLNSRINEDF